MNQAGGTPEGDFGYKKFIHLFGTFFSEIEKPTWMKVLFSPFFLYYWFFLRDSLSSGGGKPFLALVPSWREYNIRSKKMCHFKYVLQNYHLGMHSLKSHFDASKFSQVFLLHFSRARFLKSAFFFAFDLQ